MPADDDDYLWDRSGPADPDVAKLEQLMAPLAHQAPLREPPLRKRRIQRWRLAVAMAAAVIAIVIAVIMLVQPKRSSCTGTSGFAFIGRGGDVTCGGGTIAEGVLPVGASLDTGAHRAEIAIASIGTAELGPHTRVRLEETSATHHHLALDEGTLHARVNAPPRLFEVSTKHTNVVDLGCEYTIEVDAQGAGSIRVLHGKVELAAGNGAIVVAPVGTHAAILPGQRPGLPLTDRNAALATAVAAYDRDPSALAGVLAAAEPPDAITIVALAAIETTHEHDVLVRLADISPPPADVTVETALADPNVLARWREDIVGTYYGLWRPDQPGTRGAR